MNFFKSSKYSRVDFYNECLVNFYTYKYNAVNMDVYMRNSLKSTISQNITYILNYSTVSRSHTGSVIFTLWKQYA